MVVYFFQLIKKLVKIFYRLHKFKYKNNFICKNHVFHFYCIFYDDHILNVYGFKTE